MKYIYLLTLFFLFTLSSCSERKKNYEEISATHFAENLAGKHEILHVEFINDEEMLVSTENSGELLFKLQPEERPLLLQRKLNRSGVASFGSTFNVQSNFFFNPLTYFFLVLLLLIIFFGVIFLRIYRKLSRNLEVKKQQNLLLEQIIAKMR